MIEGNLIAGAALVFWPLVSFALFKIMPVGRAILASIIGAYLFLPPVPAGFDPPLFPALTKDSIPNMVIVVLCLVFAKGKIEWLPQNGIARALVLIFIFSPVLTVMANGDPVFYGRVGLPGLRTTEAIALCIQQALFLAPFLLARHYLSTDKDQRDLLLALVIGGLVYSIPALLEVRLSPQLNQWVYGFYQHSFAQTIRFGGYRPLVFLYHGIWLAFFLMTATIAAICLFRATPTKKMWKYAAAAVYLGLVLFLCKSAGALVFAVILVPIIMLTTQHIQLSVAAVVAVLAVSYPLFKQADLVPTEPLLERIEEVSLDRANSLRFRFDNEIVLLDRAYQRPAFGWGTWGRNHILDGWTGIILTVTDGRWIIVIGMFGWLGYIAEFGLLAVPILLMWWKGPHPKDKGISPYVGAIGLMLAINIFDLIPNATITPMTWLFAGAMLGYAERYVPTRRFYTDPAFNPVLQ